MKSEDTEALIDLILSGQAVTDNDYYQSNEIIRLQGYVFSE